ncbi:MAG: 2-amino-4-hydroxy-6-hydroxymethyldihydropteridine diphosphokinase [Deinococcales bacterium]
MAEAARHGAAEAGAALVALGSNLDEPAVQLRRAAAALARLATGARWSSIYRTEPVGGPPGQPAFLNAVVRLQAVPALAVLAPLCELAPQWRHPVSGEDACSALARVGSVGVQRTRLRWRPR